MASSSAPTSPDANYDIDEILKLESGDVLVAFTDGLIEAHDPADRDKLFGEDGFEKIVAQVAQIEKALGIYDLAQFTPKI